jgi:hypothetical protein
VPTPSVKSKQNRTLSSEDLPMKKWNTINSASDLPSTKINTLN